MNCGVAGEHEHPEEGRTAAVEEADGASLTSERIQSHRLISPNATRHKNADLIFHFTSHAHTILNTLWGSANMEVTDTRGETSHPPRASPAPVLGELLLGD